MQRLLPIFIARSCMADSNCGCGLSFAFLAVPGVNRWLSLARLAITAFIGINACAISSCDAINYPELGRHSGLMALWFMAAMVGGIVRRLVRPGTNTATPQAVRMCVPEFPLGQWTLQIKGEGKFVSARWRCNGREATARLSNQHAGRVRYPSASHSP